MTTPSSQDTAYTPLESLLLFHNLSTHGTHPSSFSLISNILVKNPVVLSGETYDRGRLSPDALREFYLYQLKVAEGESESTDGQNIGDHSSAPGSPKKRKGKTPPATTSGSDTSTIIKNLTSRLYERYRATVLLQIKEEEKRYALLERDIGDIAAGLWDERLLKERNIKTSSHTRSRSGTPLSTKEGQVRAGLEGRGNASIHSRANTPSKRVSPVARSPTPSQKVTPQSQTIPKPPVPQAPSQIHPTVPTVNSPQDVVTPPVLVPINIATSKPGLALSPQASRSNGAHILQSQNPDKGPLNRDYVATHPQTKREEIKQALGKGRFEFEGSQEITPQIGEQANVPRAPSASPRRNLAPKAASAPLSIPSKMESVPPPPPPNAALPVAPPPLRSQRQKIEAPVPPPTGVAFPPITPRTPSHGSPSGTPLPGSIGQQPSNSILHQNQQLPGIQGLSGLLQLADIADTRWQQQQATSPLSHGTHVSLQTEYPQHGQQASHRQLPAPVQSPPTSQGHQTPGNPGFGGGDFGVPYPGQSPTTPIHSLQQSPHTRTPQMAISSSVYQHYPPSPQVVVQHHQSMPRKARLSPINTTPSNPSASSQNSAQKEVREGDELSTPPGSPIPPGPDEISPISTPSRTPSRTPEPSVPSQQLIVDRTRGSKKRVLGGENISRMKQKTWSRTEDVSESRSENQGRPTAKRHKSTKYTPPVEMTEPSESGTPMENDKDDSDGRRTVSADLSTDGGDDKDEKMDDLSHAGEVKTEEEEEDLDMASATPTTSSEKEQEIEVVSKRKTGKGNKKSTHSKAAAGSEEKAPLKTKGTKRKRADTTIHSEKAEDDGDATPDLSPSTPKPPTRVPKLENQSSNFSLNMPSPSPMSNSVGDQQMIIATKKFMQLSTPLLSDISGHKFASLFMTPVNERMAPGYRNLVNRPQDLKSIKAAVKFGSNVVAAASTGTPSITTPTTESMSTPTPGTTTTTFATVPATTLNTPPKGIVNSTQLEKELFRMFANAIMYNKSTSEIAKETLMMARDVERTVDNFRLAEEAGTRKALGAAAVIAMGVKKMGARETTVGTVAEEDMEDATKTEDAGADEDSVLGDARGGSGERDEGETVGKGKGKKRKRKR